MADNTINVRIKQRVDTETNWNSTDPVLLKGEIAISSDKNNKYKVGDGTSKWSALSYAKAKLEKSDVTTALGYTPPTTNTTYNTGTASTSGLTKLYTGTGTATDGTMTQAAIKSALDGKINTSSHSSGEGFEFGYNNSKTITIVKTSAVTTYYVKIAENASFRFKNYYIKTRGNNTQFSFTMQAFANAYMPPNAILNTQSYNSSEIKNVIFAKNASNTAYHDIYLEIDSATGYDKTIYVFADTALVAISSTTKPSNIALTIPITNENFVYNTKKTYFSSGIVGTVNGYTINSNVPSNAKFTDTNTWRGIQDNLTSDSATDSLSAKQGKALKTLVDGKAASTLTSLNDIKASINNKVSVRPEANALASSPFSRDYWHDHFAFLNTYTIVSNQVTTDNSTWKDDTTSLNDLFCQKEKVSITILSKDILARRFILNSSNLSYSGINWFEFGVAYTNPFSEFNVLIELSSDNSTWKTISDATINSNSNPYFIYGYCMGEEKYIRFTLTKTKNIDTGTVSLTCIKALSSRKGNQGMGIENEYPYDWNFNRDILPLSNGKSSLGSSNMKWNHVYSNNFDGNASSATKLTTSAGSATQPVYFSDGKPVATTYTLGKSVPSNAIFTDTNTWRPLGTTADTACAGNDSRLSNSRPASDVKAWAKADTKPSYTWSEIGSKPTTFTPSTHNHDNSTITSLDAAKLTGTIDIARLPQGALDRLIKVTDDDTRFKLTTSSVQLGDTVKVTSTGKMYIVVDESKLSSEDGYEVYTADTAASVPWSGITGKPSTYTPSSHTHNYAGSSSAGGDATRAITVKDSTDGQNITITYGKSAQSSTSWLASWNGRELGSISPSKLSVGKVNGHTVDSDVPSDAVFTDTTYNIFTGCRANPQVNGSSGLVPAPSSSNYGQFLRSDGTWATPTNTTYSTMTAATSSAAGKSGLVPAPAAGKQGQYLRGDGTWATPTNTTYGMVSTTGNGLMYATDKQKLDGFVIAATDETETYLGIQ